MCAIDLRLTRLETMPHEHGTTDQCHTAQSHRGPAFAYLDPSTGSMILSAVVGIFATVGLALKTYWYKLKSIFGGSKQDQQLTANSAEEREASQGDAS